MADKSSKSQSDLLKPGEIILSVRDLHKSYGPKVVHKGVSFDLLKGEILGLFGGSGTGKSVILRSVIGLEKPDKGSILFESQDLATLLEEELFEVRKKIGFVFQNGALFDSMTVEENLAYPLIEHTKMSHAEIRAAIAELLDLIGLQGSEKLLPASLSGGMQKRLGVARTIILKPRIILYDEPTAGLDPSNTQRLLDLMVRVKKRERNTAIFVTHDIPSAFQVADRIAILYNGRIHTIDTAENVKKSSDPFVEKFLSGEETL
ncbi:MAG: ATP-binding cassette domain-containing protein [Deltaproteobacteria bacterium]|nr:ATP-binding cassette domain-containing protein [Deltaproteobacteria bacterium]